MTSPFKKRGMPGVRVDGNDIFAVIKVTRDAVERAARGEGSTLIEAMTYRLSGHSTSDDPKAYRPDGTVDPWRAQDPMARLRRYLHKHHGWTDARDLPKPPTQTFRDWWTKEHQQPEQTGESASSKMVV